MITYVNTVLVSNLASSNVITTKAAYDAASTSDAGKFVVITLDNAAANGDTNFPVVTSSTAASYEKIKVGLITNKTVTKVNYSTGATSNVPVIKWSNVITTDSVKSYNKGTYSADSEDACYIDFTNLDSSVLAVLAQGGKRIIVRLTFKDLPTRFRKWTESYEYVTVANDTKATIAAKIANIINKQYKRARVSAVVGVINSTSTDADATVGAKYFHKDSNWGTSTATTGTVVQLVAMPYDDDDSVDSLNLANKVRFNTNVYYTNPAAEGWEANNKNFPVGVSIIKTPGKTYQASGKLVRDREAQAMGYQGILNRGEGTWPIVKPDMVTDIDGHYNYITLEFERMYRSADDLQRKTKETVEIYTKAALSGLTAILEAFMG